tara:strand:+ start:198 stop:509 length:312 start_codon:yes stop_codon:yes gene_type:complete
VELTLLNPAIQALFMGEVESKGRQRSMRFIPRLPLPPIQNNGDYMTDEKTTKELMKALIEYLRAKTEESKTDNEFTKRILIDEDEITYTEEQSWPKEFEERWG